MSLKVVPFSEGGDEPAPMASSGVGMRVPMQAPLVGPPRHDNEYLRAAGYDLLQATASEGFGASAAKSLEEEGVVGPILSELKRRRAQGETTEVWTPYTALGLLAKQQAPAVTPMAEEEWKQSPYARPGLSYTEGMTAEWAQMLAERHDTQAKRNDIIARSSAWATIPGAFAGQLVDPIGLAANFVPIISEARYAAMATRLGRYGARAATGLIEGAVGQAALEPFIYAAAQGDQRDYDFTDSLSNIAMGGVFGAGLHSALGGVGDLLLRRGVQAHVEAGDIAVRQAALGHDIDVSPALRGAELSADIGSSRQAPLDIGGIREAAGAADRAAVAQMRAGSRAYQAEQAARPLTIEQRQKLVERELTDQFPTQDVRTAAGGTVRRSGPLDIVTWLRTKGGLKDDPGGEVAARDFREFNKGRVVQFAKGERFLGRLVDSERGMTLEQAAAAAAENGYIRPKASGAGDVSPTGVPELMEAIERTLRVGEDLENRAWRETDFEHVQAYYSAARGLDEEAHINPTTQRGLGDVPKAPPGPVEDDYFFDPIDDVDMIDDPEALLAEAEEWAAGGRMDQAEVDQAAEKAATVDANDPVIKAERYGAAVKAMAACMAGVAA